MNSYTKCYYSLLILTIFLAIGCSHRNYASKPAYLFKSKSGAPDYSDLNYWAANPYKNDPSDSIPAPLRKQSVKDSTVDVFFIYPTTLTDKDNPSWNAEIDDSVLNAKTDYSTILYQASAFNNGTRIFAPRYRQAHYRAFTSADKKRSAEALEFAYQDVKKAFEYYLEHYNQGRPIIIASHSQGTIHAGHLLRDFFEGKNLQNRLVCAYLIGMPVRNDYFKKIPACSDSLATGCFVSWRSFASGYEGEEYILKENFKAVVTNPLNWNMDSGYVPASLNKGAVLLKFNKISRGGGAEVHHNILWTAKPKFFGNIFLSSKNYHIADINLFYMNIRENVGTRIKMFWKQ